MNTCVNKHEYVCLCSTIYRSVTISTSLAFTFCLCLTFFLLFFFFEIENTFVYNLNCGCQPFVVSVAAAAAVVVVVAMELMRMVCCCCCCCCYVCTSRTLWGCFNMGFMGAVPKLGLHYGLREWKMHSRKSDAAQRQRMCVCVSVN